MCHSKYQNEQKCCVAVNYASTPSTMPERVTGCLKAPGFA